MNEIETKQEGIIDLKMLREMSTTDIFKKQVLDCLSIGNKDPQNFPNAVNMLERLFIDELNDEYKRKILAREEEAKKKFPIRPEGSKSELAFNVYIAIEKFALLFNHIKSNIPEDIVLKIDKNDENE